MWPPVGGQVVVELVADRDAANERIIGTRREERRRHPVRRKVETPALVTHPTQVGLPRLSREVVDEEIEAVTGEGLLGRQSGVLVLTAEGS